MSDMTDMTDTNVAPFRRRTHPGTPALEGFQEHNGIPVSSIGEDGDLIALGHHNPRATAAAMTAYARDVIDGEAPEVDPAEVTRQHAIHWNDALDEWQLTVSREPSPGSFPVTYWSAS